MDDNRKSPWEELVAAAEALAAAGQAVGRAEPAANIAPLVSVAAGSEPKTTAGSSGSTASDWAESAVQQLLKPVTAMSPGQGWVSSLLPSPGGTGGGWPGGGLLKSILSPLFSLFSFGGGNDEPAAVELPRYLKPARQTHSLSIRSADDWAFNASDFDSTGRARQVPSNAPQVVVQVNAMDSRSFVDHSQEIADAVRRAVLESNSLGDLIREMEG